MSRVGRMEEKGTVQAKEGQKENNLHRKRKKDHPAFFTIYIFYNYNNFFLNNCYHASRSPSSHLNPHAQVEKERKKERKKENRHEGLMFQ